MAVRLKLLEFALVPLQSSPTLLDYALPLLLRMRNIQWQRTDHLSAQPNGTFSQTVMTSFHSYQHHKTSQVFHIFILKNVI